MFPVTITLHDAAQLNAVMHALSPTTAAPKSASAASGPVTAKASAAPEKMAAVQNLAAASAETAHQASTAATTEAGNAAAAPSAPEAPAASPVSFDVLKKAFLSLSTKPEGRSKCEGVLKPLGLAKLSEAKEGQYAALLDAINKASV